MLKFVQSVHMGFTAVNHASVKIMLFAQTWMVSVLACQDGMADNVNCNATLDTMGKSVVRSVCV